MADPKTLTKTSTDGAADALLQSKPRELDSLEGLLQKLSPEDQAHAFRILYGEQPDTLPVTAELQAYCDQHDFELQAYKFHAAPEQRRAPRVVRVGVIQNQIVLPTTDPVEDQFQALADRLEIIIEAAAKMGVNVLGLQEAWTMPFAFCTREKEPWLEFSEPIDGPSTQFLQELASATTW